MGKELNVYMTRPCDNAYISFECKSEGRGVPLELETEKNGPSIRLVCHVGSRPLISTQQEMWL
jgi:hypothetical protein